MSDLSADIIGIAGGLLFITAFAYANWVRDFDRLWFNAANLLGAIMLMLSLSVHFNLAAFLLEAAWGTIALAGLAAESHRRLRRARR